MPVCFARKRTSNDGASDWQGLGSPPAVDENSRFVFRKTGSTTSNLLAQVANAFKEKLNRKCPVEVHAWVRTPQGCISRKKSAAFVRNVMIEFKLLVTFTRLVNVTQFVVARLLLCCN